MFFHPHPDLPIVITESSLSHEETMKVYESVKVLQRRTRASFYLCMASFVTATVLCLAQWTVLTTFVGWMLTLVSIASWFVGRHCHNRANQELLTTGIDLRCTDL